MAISRVPTQEKVLEPAAAIEQGAVVVERQAHQPPLAKVGERLADRAATHQLDLGQEGLARAAGAPILETAGQPRGEREGVGESEWLGDVVRRRLAVRGFGEAVAVRDERPSGVVELGRKDVTGVT